MSTAHQRRRVVRVLGAALACTVAITVAFAAGDVMHDPHAPKAAAPGSAEAAYLAENETAMNEMMADMAVKPTGDVDRDFVAMMEPHHRGAIAMAQALLRYGKNEQLRRIAQDIVRNQQAEIVAMHAAVDAPPPAKN